MQKRRRLVPGRIPDPLRAHGAWVYLAVAILAGALTSTSRPSLAALLVGTGFVGVFVLASSLAIARRPSSGARFLFGSLLAAGSWALALRLGANQAFLAVALAALPPAALAARFASQWGFLSPAALTWSVLTLVVAAPSVASAGGASPLAALLVAVLLAPFFSWRTWRLARDLGQGWTRERLVRQGLLESALAVTWGALSVAAVRVLG